MNRLLRSPALTALAAAVVVAIVAVCLAAVATVHSSDARASDRDRDAALSAATYGVAQVLSYDYRHLQQDFRTAEALLTPHFRKEYDRTTAKGVEPLAAKYKARSTAEVSAASVVAVHGDRASVLLFVSQTVTNSQLAAPRLDRSRISVTLLRSGSRWLIDKLNPI